MPRRWHHAAPVDGSVAGDVRAASASDGRVGGLDEFLASTGVDVLDVGRGAAAGTRRLLLGEPGSESATYVVAVADHPGSATAIESEIRTLGELQTKALPSVLATLPRVVAKVTVGDRPAVVMTAVPGLRPEQPWRGQQPAVRVELDAVWSWLATLWHTTGRIAEPVELGRYAADLLLARFCGSRQLAPTLGAVHRARSRLGHLRVVRTAVHGCLCPRHAHVRGGVVVGVDDWGLASPNGQPLRDLGGFAVRYAGSRLPEMVADQTSHAHLLRDFVTTGLVAVGLPGSHWRDVLILVQVERAVAALARGEVNEIGLLAAAVDALPREPEESEAARS